MMSMLFKISLVFTITVIVTNAVYEGYEQYSNDRGLFWVSCNEGMAIVDPIAQKVVKVIPCPTTKWGDSAYIRDQAQIKHYTFANDYMNNQVLVFDAMTQSLLTKVQLSPGANPLHMYSVYYYDQVWVHEDGTGSFDVFRTAQVRYRESAGVRASTLKNGHGKLLANPNLEDTGFATNVKSGAIYKIDIPTRALVSTVTLNSSIITTQGYACVGTHGIDYSSVNNRIYVECSNPSNCPSSKDDSKTCTGAVWGVDAVSLQVMERIVSQPLSNKYGKNFGVQGQVVHSPEYTFLLVANTALNVLHFLKPTNTTTLVIDMPLDAPGVAQFYPKDSSIVFGTDSNASNYWACIPVKDGVAFIDMHTVVKAFAAGLQSLPASAASVVTYNNYGGGRTILRGGDYIIAASYASATTTKGLIFINIKTRAVSFMDGVALGASKFVYVPSHTDEVQYTVTQLAQTQLDTVDFLANMTGLVKLLQTEITALKNDNPTSYEENTRKNAGQSFSIGVAAIVLSLLALVVSALAIGKTWVGVRSAHVPQFDAANPK